MKDADSLYLNANARETEKKLLSAVPHGTLMAKAGTAVFEAALSVLGDDTSKKVLLFAGPGNNGGDAYEAAAHLSSAGFGTHVVCLASSKPLSPETALAVSKAEKASVVFHKNPSSSLLKRLSAGRFALAVDGLFGTGLNSPVSGFAAECVSFLNGFDGPVIAIDIPSGLGPDTGMPVAGGPCVIAGVTVSLLTNKPGLYTGRGRDFSGRVIFDALGTDPLTSGRPDAFLNTPALFVPTLPKRLFASHKGTFGTAAIVGGARSMTGAVLLASRAALMCGAGKTFAVFLENAPAVDFAFPEIMISDVGSFGFDCSAAAIGPGLGTSQTASHTLTRVLSLGVPVLLDADALNLIAGNEKLADLTKNREPSTVITPHPLEAARLLGTDVASVQGNRIAAATALSEKLGCVCVLKGSGTVIADNRTSGIRVNETGGPALATAGSGDVLSGVITALMASGVPAFESACAGVWLHGAAGDELTRIHGGPVGTTAGEIAGEVRNRLNRMLAGS